MHYSPCKQEDALRVDRESGGWGVEGEHREWQRERDKQKEVKRERDVRKPPHVTFKGKKNKSENPI